ncbi:hypothetical protein FVE85_7237 [Porphyridium purpureum]|uniref:Uncharacterized protein n=1 Tax=Porphyridium purpureum TaxID=35688 RepID=A0A5J4Z9A2_PORPP|nr:hypothetical protein FVE85_7237 [Porphyridium purpureum]|eukprot:POR0218..scf295_1
MASLGPTARRSHHGKPRAHAVAASREERLHALRQESAQRSRDSRERRVARLRQVITTRGQSLSEGSSWRASGEPLSPRSRRRSERARRTFAAEIKMLENGAEAMPEGDLDAFIESMLKESDEDEVVDGWSAHVEEIQEEEDALFLDDFESLQLTSSRPDVTCPLCLSGSLRADAHCTSCAAQYTVCCCSEKDPEMRKESDISGRGKTWSCACETQRPEGQEFRVLNTIRDALCAAAEMHAGKCSHSSAIFRIRSEPASMDGAVVTHEARLPDSAHVLELHCASCQLIYLLNEIRVCV